MPVSILSLNFLYRPTVAVAFEASRHCSLIS